MGGDPFESLGFGMSAYINTLSTLVLTFIVITCVTYPVRLSYKNGVNDFYKAFNNVGDDVIDEEIMPSNYGN